jgi:hypothetical protein
MKMTIKGWKMCIFELFLRQKELLEPFGAPTLPLGPMPKKL